MESGVSQAGVHYVAGGVVLLVVFLLLYSPHDTGPGELSHNSLALEAQKFYDASVQSKEHDQALLFASYSMAYFRITDFSKTDKNINFPDLMSRVESRLAQLQGQAHGPARMERVETSQTSQKKVKSLPL